MVTKKRSQLERAPLTTEELERLLLNSDERIRTKLTEHEEFRLRKIIERREQERLESVARLRVEERPIVADLHKVGWEVESVSDLVNTSAKYPEAVPVLLKHLQMPYSDAIREAIARALAVREARYAWPTLVAEYREAPMGKGIKALGDTKEFRLGAKDGLACAVAATVTEETLDELIELVKDRANGESRGLLLPPLRSRRFKNPKIKQVLEDLASDPDLWKEIASWKKKK